jgi:hypothetical protein
MDNKHHDLYRSPNVDCVIKSKMIWWAWHVARMGQKRKMHTGLSWANLNEINHLDHLAVTESIILKWMINKYGEYVNDSSGSEWELVDSSCK